jgi:hypothetical protein
MPNLGFHPNCSSYNFLFAVIARLGKRHPAFCQIAFFLITGIYPR